MHSGTLRNPLQQVSQGKLKVDIGQPMIIMNTMTLKGYLTVPEFAKELGISRQAIHKAIEKGRIKKVERLSERVMVIHESELKRFKKEG